MNNTKEKIFENALKLFAQKGFDNVTIKEITGASGINASTFYRHYKNKDEILDEIFIIMEENLNKIRVDYEIVNELTDKLTLEEYLKLILDKMVENQQDPHFYNVLYVVAMEEYRNARAGELSHKRSYIFIESTSSAFKRFQEKNKMKPGDPYVLANLYGYSMKAIHFDYALRKIHNKETSDIEKKMYQSMEMFSRTYSM